VARARAARRRRPRGARRGARRGGWPLLHALLRGHGHDALLPTICTMDWLLVVLLHC
jgi:hypothetical protein